MGMLFVRRAMLKGLGASYLYAQQNQKDPPKGHDF